MANAPNHTLIYTGDLPRNVAALHWRIRYRQRQKAIRQFGALPPSLWATRFAEVTICRVQGPRQRELDDDVFRMACRGLRDALTACGYILDDGPRYARFTYVEDSTRRAQGPRVEIAIAYTDDSLPRRRVRSPQA